MTPITLLAVFTIVFIVLRIAPGDPAAVVLGSFASEQALQAVRSSMGLDSKQLLTYSL